MATAAIANRLPVPSREEQAVIYLNRFLIVGAVACSILSVIPSFRVAGSLGLRGIALLSSLTGASTNRERRAWYLGKIAVITTGIVGLAISSPMIIVASLITDMALQLFEIIRAIRNGEGKKALIHATLLMLDAFALASILTGSWQLMVTAGAVSAAFMAAMFIRSWIHAVDRKQGGKAIDTLSYLALSVIGVVAAANICENDTLVRTDYHITDTQSTPMTINETGQVIQPGQTADFSITPNHPGGGGSDDWGDGYSFSVEGHWGGGWDYNSWYGNYSDNGFDSGDGAQFFYGTPVYDATTPGLSNPDQLAAVPVGLETAMVDPETLSGRDPRLLAERVQGGV